MKCPHEIEIGSQGGAVEEFVRQDAEQGIDDEYLCAFHSACDCCDYMMHHDTPYMVLADGRTLCPPCYRGEPLNLAAHGKEVQ